MSGFLTWTTPTLQPLTCQETYDDYLYSTGLYFAFIVSCLFLYDMKQSLSFDFFPPRPLSVCPFPIILQFFVIVHFLVLWALVVLSVLDRYVTVPVEFFLLVRTTPPLLVFTEVMGWAFV